MPRLRKEEWDTPGGPGGQEEIERIAGNPRTGTARSLYHQWREAVDEVADVRRMKATVSPQVFNTFRRDRLQSGITDAQLADSFQIFATAVAYGPINVRHGDLWRSYAASWARWVSSSPAPATRPLKARTRSSDWQR